jgi:hypothetical protein
MKIIHSVEVLTLVTTLVLQGAGPGLAETMSWQDAVGQLAHERTIAERCVAVLKKYGDDAQRARGDLSYARAKADSDAVIAGLTTALSERETPAGLPGLQTKLKSSASGLVEFCDGVDKLIPATASGQKGVLDDIAKVIPLEQLLKALSDAISALYVNYRSDEALTRRTIQTQLEAARWPAFSEVKAAQ